MSKQLSKGQASRSSVNDSLGHTAKDVQRPVTPAHQYGGDRTSSDPCESRDRTPKRKPQPAHQTHFHDLKGEHEETLRKGAFPNRKAPGDARPRS